MEYEFVPGVYVILVSRPDWGVGQVQSAVDGRITINFQEAGKQVVNAAHASLKLVEEDTNKPASA